MRDYLVEMLNSLTSAYSRKDYDNKQIGLPVETKIGKLFSVLAWGLDSVQEQAELIKIWDNIDNARGSVLDRYGVNFGVKRNGAGDAFYRLLIKVKLLSQLSGGDINTVINVAASLFSLPAEKITLSELFPAKISVEVDEAELGSDALSVIEDIAAMIKRIVAAGIGTRLVLRAYKMLPHTVVINTTTAEYVEMTFRPVNQARSYQHHAYVNSTIYEIAEITAYPAN
jgi:hypothetical protein